MVAILGVSNRKKLQKVPVAIEKSHKNGQNGA